MPTIILLIDLVNIIAPPPHLKNLCLWLIVEQWLNSKRKGSYRWTIENGIEKQSLVQGYSILVPFKFDGKGLI